MANLTERNTIHCIDCMEGMAQMPDNYIDLAIVDPPYGIGMPVIEAGKWKREIHNKEKRWDDMPPSKEYFIELRRISTNRIIWGANYFIEYLESTPCVVWWDKNNGNNFMADGELAWLSFNSGARRFVYSHIQEYNAGKHRIHPTQKPVDLYKWLLTNYAKEGDLILDTHMGSGSSYIACLDMGFDYIGYEIDADYFAAIEDRVYHFTRQTTLALDAT